MTKFDCVGCQKEHDDWAWRNTTYQFEDGERSGWFCTKWHKPSGAKEWTTESIKQQRKEFAKDLIQPYRGGEPNKEFIKEYPHESKQYFTEKQIRKAKKKVL